MPAIGYKEAFSGTTSAYDKIFPTHYDTTYGATFVKPDGSTSVKTAQQIEQLLNKMRLDSRKAEEDRLNGNTNGTSLDMGSRNNSYSRYNNDNNIRSNQQSIEVQTDAVPPVPFQDQAPTLSPSYVNPYSQPVYGAQVTYVSPQPAYGTQQFMVPMQSQTAFTPTTVWPNTTTNVQTYTTPSSTPIMYQSQPQQTIYPSTQSFYQPPVVYQPQPIYQQQAPYLPTQQQYQQQQPQQQQSSYYAPTQSAYGLRGSAPSVTVANVPTLPLRSVPQWAGPTGQPTRQTKKQKQAQKELQYIQPGQQQQQQTSYAPSYLQPTVIGLRGSAAPGTSVTALIPAPAALAVTNTTTSPMYPTTTNTNPEQVLKQREKLRAAYRNLAVPNGTRTQQEEADRREKIEREKKHEAAKQRAIEKAKAAPQRLDEPITSTRYNGYDHQNPPDRPPVVRTKLKKLVRGSTRSDSYYDDSYRRPGGGVPLPGSKWRGDGRKRDNSTDVPLTQTIVYQPPAQQIIVQQPVIELVQNMPPTYIATTTQQPIMAQTQTTNKSYGYAVVPGQGGGLRGSAPSSSSITYSSNPNSGPVQAWNGTTTVPIRLDGTAITNNAAGRPSPSNPFNSTNVADILNQSVEPDAWSRPMNNNNGRSFASAAIGFGKKHGSYKSYVLGGGINLADHNGNPNAIPAGRQQQPDIPWTIGTQATAQTTTSNVPYATTNNAQPIYVTPMMTNTVPYMSAPYVAPGLPSPGVPTPGAPRPSMDPYMVQQQTTIAPYGERLSAAAIGFGKKHPDYRKYVLTK